MKKEDATKTKSKKEVKSTKKADIKKEGFFSGVRKEMKKVRWPLKKEMAKYSIATISFIVFFALFFTAADLLIAAVKMLVS